MIVDSGNDYLGALKGNQSGLLSAVERNFQPEQTVQQLDKGHGRIEKRAVSISHTLDGIPDFPGLATLIRVESERQVLKHSLIEVSRETRYNALRPLATRLKPLQLGFGVIGALRTKCTTCGM